MALLGWLLLATPLTALTRWLRTLPGLRRVFDEHSEPLITLGTNREHATATGP